MDHGLKGLTFITRISVVYVVFAILLLVGLYEERSILTITAYAIASAVLLAAGLIGITTVKRVRQNRLDRTRFRTLAILNLTLGVLAIFDLLGYIIILLCLTTNLFDDDWSEMLRIPSRHDGQLVVIAGIVYGLCALAAVAVAVMGFTAARICGTNSRVLAVRPPAPIESTAMVAVVPGAQKTVTRAGYDEPPAYHEIFPSGRQGSLV